LGTGQTRRVGRPGVRVENRIGSTIVGVVKDVRENGHQSAVRPGFYYTGALPQGQRLDYLIVRTLGRPNDLVEPIHRIIARVDPDQPVSAVRTFDEIVDQDVADRQQQMALLASFCGARAAVGVDWDLRRVVVRGQPAKPRARIAHRARRHRRVDDERLVLGRGLLLTGAGVVLGTALAWASTRTLQNLLYGVSTLDPRTFAAVVVCLTVTTLVACYMPARRAAHLDPIVALRDE